jgi:hypothetical protein
VLAARALNLLKAEIRQRDSGVKAVDETALALVGAQPEQVDRGIATLLELKAAALVESA